MTVDEAGVAVMQSNAILKQNLTEIGSAIANKSFPLSCNLRHDFELHEPAIALQL
ncbi:MAG TPA: hypothetical protein V6D16_11920 [Candidatus Obscuribacterales bacterium]